MKFIVIFAALLLAAPMGHAETKLRKLVTADQARAWSGVGRLNIVKVGGGEGFCSGALIEPDLVLTAAHCVVDSETAEVALPENVKFLAGYRDGQAKAYGQAKDIVVHEAYKPSKNITDFEISADLALIKLQHKMIANGVRPFEVQKQPQLGDKLTVVSYARERSETPSIEKDCKVLAARDRVLMASCKVDFGASGSPMFVIENGVPKIASVVSAKARNRQGQPVSAGVSLGAPLQELRRLIGFSTNVFQSKKPGKSLAEQLGRK